MVDLTALLSLHVPLSDTPGRVVDVLVSGPVADCTKVTSKTVLEVNGQRCSVAVSANLAQDVAMVVVRDTHVGPHGLSRSEQRLVVYVHPALCDDQQKLYGLLRQEGVPRQEAQAAVLAATS